MFDQFLERFENKFGMLWLVDLYSIHRLYYVNCTTGSSSDLSAVTNQSVYIFQAGDGVEYGTEYGCTIQLHASNHTSIETVPAYVTTIEAPGMLMLIWKGFENTHLIGLFSQILFLGETNVNKNRLM